MKAAELREMSDEQLQATLNETCESLFRLRIQSQTERLDAPSELQRNRRLIARIKTIQREREIARQRLRSAADSNRQIRQAAIEGQANMPKTVAVGVVTSDKMTKTRRVEIPRLVQTSEVRQVRRRKTVCYVHDENNESQRRRHGGDHRVAAAVEDEALGTAARDFEEHGGRRGRAASGWSVTRTRSQTSAS